MPYLTKQLIHDLLPKDKPYKVSDEMVPGKSKSQGVPGLLVRVCPGGAKTFAIQYRVKNEGRKGWYPIGRFGIITLDQARDEARNQLRAVSQGEDPGRKLRDDRGATTMAQLVDRFILEHVGGLAPRSAAEYARLMRKHIVPALGTRKAMSVGTGDMSELLSSIRKETATEANRVLAVARKMFNLAELWEVRVLGSNPLRGQVRATETARARRMLEVEIRALGKMIREVQATTAAGEVDGATLQPESIHSL